MMRDIHELITDYDMFLAMARKIDLEMPELEIMTYVAGLTDRFKNMVAEFHTRQEGTRVWDLLKAVDKKNIAATQP